MSVYGYCRGVAEHFSLKVSHVTVCNIVKESRN
jgi:hypothetical protein